MPDNSNGRPGSTGMPNEDRDRAPRWHETAARPDMTWNEPFAPAAFPVLPPEVTERYRLRAEEDAGEAMAAMRERRGPETGGSGEH